jgi:hypothetical protein
MILFAAGRNSVGHLMLMPKKLVIVIAVAITASLLAVVIPAFLRARAAPATHGCINNLLNIDVAKQQWALENHKTTNDAPTWNDIRPYLGRGTAGEIPVCPNGATYILGRVGEPPKCSIGGPDHSLP